MTGWIDTAHDRINNVISSHGPQKFFSLATFLRAASIPYGGLVRWRRRLYRRGNLRTHVLPCPVISIGNLEVGGTGKTPMTMELAESILRSGYRPAIISRGYRGNRSEDGAVVGDGHSLLLTAAEAGDEPYLMASLLKSVPVVIGRDRFAAGKLAIKRFQPHILILDDGFQHLRLHRDLDVVLLDSSHPFGNGFMLPRGRLREPVGALSRAHAVVLTRCGACEPEYFRQLSQALGPRPLFRARHRTQVRRVVPAGTAITPMTGLSEVEKPQVDKELSGKNLFVFSGLARNESFWQNIKELGGNLCDTLAFGDHHQYKRGDMHHIILAARQAEADCLATTEKDYVRIPGDTRLPMNLIVLGVSIDFAADHKHWQWFMQENLKRLLKSSGKNPEGPSNVHS